MADLRLTLAITAYDRVLPLINGEVKPDGITLEYAGMPGGIPRVFYEQIKFQRYDISEMSLSSFLRMRPYRVAVPHAARLSQSQLRLHHGPFPPGLRDQKGPPGRPDRKAVRYPGLSAIRRPMDPGHSPDGVRSQAGGYGLVSGARGALQPYRGLGGGGAGTPKKRDPSLRHG